MLIKNTVYTIALFLDMVSILCLIMSIKTKDKFIFKNIIILSGVNLIYSILNLCLLEILSTPVGFELIYIGALTFISGIIYIIAIFISGLKRNKKNKFKNYKTIFMHTIFILIIPISFFMINFLNAKVMINSSDLILIFKSDGNGGIGDSDTFAYAIRDNSCKQFDLGIDINFKNTKPENMILIDNIKDNTKFNVIINENESISIYNENNHICELNKDSKYFNIELQESYYKK